MRTYFISICLIIISNCIICQTSTDSLLLEAKKNHINSNFVQALESLLILKNQFEIHNDYYNLCNIHLQLGLLYMDWKISDKAIESFTDCINFNKKFRCGIDKSYLNGQLAKAYLLANKPDSAIVYFSYEYAYYANQNQTKAQIASLYEMTAVYSQLSDYSKIISCNLEIFRLSESLKDTAEMIKALNNIGFTHKNMGNDEYAIKYFEKIMIINSTFNQSNINQIEILINIADLNVKLKRDDEALKLLNKALMYAEQNKDTISQIVVLHRQASVYFNCNKSKIAIKKAEQSKMLLTETTPLKYLLSTYKLLFSLYFVNKNEELQLQNFELYEHALLRKNELERKESEALRSAYRVIEENERKIEQLTRENELKQAEMIQIELRAENNQKQAEILLNEKEIAEVNLQREKLEKEKTKLQLLAYQSQCEANSKDIAIQALEKDRQINTLKMKKAELEATQNKMKIDILIKDNRFKILVRNFLIVLISFLIAFVIFAYRNFRVMLTKKRKIIEDQQIIHRQEIEIQNAKISKAEAESEQAKLKLKNENLKADKMKSELRLKQRQLLSFTMLISRKNCFLLKLKEIILSELKDMKGISDKIQKINHSIDNHIQFDDDWENFRLYFEEVHGEFFKKMKELVPNLSQNDLKHCALSRLNLSLKEVAEMLAISVQGVKQARYRLREKIGLPAKTNLYDYLINVGENNNSFYKNIVKN